MNDEFECLKCHKIIVKTGNDFLYGKDQLKGICLDCYVDIEIAERLNKT